MAIYHFSTNVHSRKKGHSAVNAAAYRSNQELYCERTGQTYSWRQYRQTHGDVLAAKIFLPDGAEHKYFDRGTLWNGAESVEKTKGGAYKKTAAVAREMEGSLPFEMTSVQREETAIMAGKIFVKRYGAAVDMSIHSPDKNGDERNFHVHYLMTTRKLGAHGFTDKTELELDGKTKKKLGFSAGKKQIVEMREIWEDVLNKQLERYGYSDRVDHRSFKGRGIEREAQRHLGRAHAMEQKGDMTLKGKSNREIKKENETIDFLEHKLAQVEEKIKQERERQRTQIPVAINYERGQLIPDYANEQPADLTAFFEKKAEEERQFFEKKNREDKEKERDQDQELER